MLSRIHKIKALTQLVTQSTLHIDLSQWSTTTPSSASVEISGLQIYKDDVQTIQPKSMITDTIVSFLFKQLRQIHPIVSSFCYTTLCEEQDVGPSTSRMAKHQQKSFLEADLLNSRYVFLQIYKKFTLAAGCLNPMVCISGYLQKMSRSVRDVSAHSDSRNVSAWKK
ncbi:PREDICTED: uncharacterized protein LOC107353497 [Acropora digitifera]|uniref:uncharacterized protein LOC107353497 n=1 Tax=Acropora digitifera TaxID=70779 RepID=UPI00077A9B6A|nr:PREDICTED: uncharacterized protein LOC107353497 [Acropora digitifera]